MDQEEIIERSKLRETLLVLALVRVVYLVLSTTEERRQDKSLLFQRVDGRNRGHYPEKQSWVCVPVCVDPVGRKLNITENRRQDQSSLFRRGHRTKGHNEEKGTNLSWVRVPMTLVCIAVITVDNNDTLGFEIMYLLRYSLMGQ